MRHLTGCNAGDFGPCTCHEIRATRIDKINAARAASYRTNLISSLRRFKMDAAADEIERFANALNRIVAVTDDIAAEQIARVALSVCPTTEPCVHAPIIGLKGGWICQFCNEPVDMTLALSRPSQNSEAK